MNVHSRRRWGAPVAVLAACVAIIAGVVLTRSGGMAPAAPRDDAAQAELDAWRAVLPPPRWQAAEMLSRDWGDPAQRERAQVLLARSLALEFVPERVPAELLSRARAEGLALMPWGRADHERDAGAATLRALEGRALASVFRVQASCEDRERLAVLAQAVAQREASVLTAWWALMAVHNARTKGPQCAADALSAAEAALRADPCVAWRMDNALLDDPGAATQAPHGCGEFRAAAR